MATQAVPTGNTFDKYGSSNPAVRRLMKRFEHNADELIARAAPKSILDVGCGEGILTERWSREFPQARLLGVDLEDPQLEQEWTERRHDNLEFRQIDVSAGLPFADGEFELVTATEVLEHVPSAEVLVQEMVRVARSHVLVSVPREPLWRIVNVARGAYIQEAGNTPGHVNHWSKRGLLSMLERHGDVVVVRSPFPWTMALVRVR